MNRVAVALVVLVALPWTGAIEDSVRLYTKPHFQGRSSVISMSPTCYNFPDDLNDEIESVNSGGNCLLIHEDYNCLGRTLQLFPGSRADHGDLAASGFGRTVSSMSVCTWVPCAAQAHEDGHDELRRRSGGCRYAFFDDVFTIGAIAGLAILRVDLSGPIVEVQRNPNYSRRVEYVRAEIYRRHLDQGEGTYGVARRYARTMGSEGDHAGHVIASRLGGTGRATWNIFPQSPHFNTGAYRTYVEDLVYQAVDSSGHVTFIVNLLYDGASTRPHTILYRIEYTDGYGDYQQISNDLLNPEP